MGSGRERAASAAAEDKDKDKADRLTSKEGKHLLEGRKHDPLASLFPDSRRGSYASSKGGREEQGGGCMGAYPIVTIEEATVDGHGCMSGNEDDRMLVDEEEYGLKNTPFRGTGKFVCLSKCSTDLRDIFGTLAHTCAGTRHT